jgi:hypothetical protein
MIFEKRTAIFNEGRTHRELLRIVWDEELPQLAAIGLNPSTADEFADDPTIRRIKGFARDWGFGGLQMYNLFAVRATNPKDMKVHPSPVGLGELGKQIALNKASQVLCCWGTHGKHMNRGMEALDDLKKIFSGNRMVCLGVNKDGSPKHPLYLKSKAERIPFPIECGYCDGTGEVACSSTSYMSCPACSKRNG